MVTDFLRDTLFDTAWFGLMAFVWFGWAQEDPPRRWRIWIGIGSGLGVLLAIGFGILVGLNWGAPSAMAGREAWFGVLVGAEVALAGLGCLVLWRTGRARWATLVVAVVVALHFIPLGVILSDPALPVLGVLQLVGIALAVRVARRDELQPSFPIGTVMGASLLLFAVVTAVIGVSRLVA